MEEFHKRNIVIRGAGESSGPKCTLQSRFKTVTEAAENVMNQSPTPKIQRAMSLLGHGKNFEMYYEPKVTSFGPIHHGNKKYQIGEKYKLFLTHDFVTASGKDINVLYKKIEENIKELRECFEKDVTKTYDDEDLAWLLFVDGCAVLQYIYCTTNNKFEELNIKIDSVSFVQQDLFLLENQLPYRLLKWLMSLSKMEEELMVSIETYIAKQGTVPDNQQSKQQQANGNRGGNLYLQENPQLEQRISMHKEPIHLLDLLRTSLLVCHDQRPVAENTQNKEKVQDWQSYHNVQELKAAGIHLRRSSNSCLRNISFTRRFLLLGYLYLPPIIVDDSTRPKFLNLIAYEMCQDFENDVTSYISFLNSQIIEANDVKKLRKAGILHNFLGSDEEVVQLFKEIGTDLVPNT